MDSLNYRVSNPYTMSKYIHSINDKWLQVSPARCSCWSTWPRSPSLRKKFCETTFGQKKTFWINLDPQILDRFPPESNVYKFMLALWTIILDFKGLLLLKLYKFTITCNLVLSINLGRNGFIKSTPGERPRVPGRRDEEAPQHGENQWNLVQWHFPRAMITISGVKLRIFKSKFQCY
jgi:hypothetical protein